ncbi:MAG: 16S rRNA (adenine(1518)-N(6)/adenine(1519)-N(6))-dimethyltransferase RsmA [Anaeromyxobacteraceae bacterium]
MTSTSYPSPRALLEKHGLRAKKSWGQNFLADPEVLDAIADLAAPPPGAPVVELGAGLGHLTVRLAGRGARVTAVERDRDMALVLREELLPGWGPDPASPVGAGGAEPPAKRGRIELVEADAVRVDWAAVADRLGVTRLHVAGNLPYHLSSPILFALLDHADRIAQAVFLLQREVAERLAAEPGTKDFGLLSVLLQREADVRVARRVPAGAFLPPPKVESAVLEARFRPPPGGPLDTALFRKLVKAGFAQRRKTLSNALDAARLAPPKAVEAALAQAAIDPRRRGETLEVAEWEALCRALAPRLAG